MEAGSVLGVSAPPSCLLPPNPAPVILVLKYLSCLGMEPVKFSQKQMYSFHSRAGLRKNIAAFMWHCA